MWINSPYGTGKTSSLNPIIDAKLGVVLQDYSRAGLIGSIKKDGIATIGDVRLLANTTAILEEFQEANREARACLLSLMEDKRYVRTLGFEILKPEHVIESGFGFVAEGTRISIYLQASYLVFSMAYRTSTTLDSALLSRCVPVFLDTAKEEQSDLFIKGQRLKLDIKRIKRMRRDLKDMSVIVPAELRKRIASKYEGSRIRAENMTRAMWDYTRIAYLEACATGVNEITAETIDSAEWIVKLQELGYTKRSLTKTAYGIYLFLLKQQEMLRAVEIAKELNLSREYTSRMLSDLVKKQLVHRSEISNKVVYYVE